MKRCLLVCQRLFVISLSLPFFVEWVGNEMPIDLYAYFTWQRMSQPTEQFCAHVNEWFSENSFDNRIKLSNFFLNERFYLSNEQL